MLGEGDGAYAELSVTEPSTTQLAPLRSNPFDSLRSLRTGSLGDGSFAASLCCVLSHRGPSYAPSDAPRSAAKLLAAIDAATASEAP